ncbi:hypothetical protein EJ08DRAFT_650821 [Tothia fuscella]|uniref:Uncharacterized protein n=1 Tax=Tothia fuscella TaxID=1048955 RepID=A0A9P4NNN9_9PEZI|nr:hypothetical protein EJ08DRAFT_650821 [Tothia fuscella]
MGSLCSRDSSSEDNFAGPGRTLGHAPPKTTNNTRAPIPSSAKQHHQQPQQQGTPPPPPKVGGQGHVLGSSSDSDPRDAAARAAEVRKSLVARRWHFTGR